MLSTGLRVWGREPLIEAGTPPDDLTRGWQELGVRTLGAWTAELRPLWALTTEGAGADPDLLLGSPGHVHAEHEAPSSPGSTVHSRHRFLVPSSSLSQPRARLLHPTQLRAFLIEGAAWWPLQELEDRIVEMLWFVPFSAW